MTDCKPIYSPIKRNLRLEPATEIDNKIQEKYRSMLDSLMYIMLGSRPDLNYAVSFFARFQNKASAIHLNYLTRCVRNLRTTMDLKLVFKRNGNSEAIDAFSDADYANEFDRKSVTGSLVRIFGNSVTWKSKKQSLVNLSSTEAEYIALANTISFTLCFKNLLTELLPFQKGPITAFEDNTSCISLAKNWKNNSRSKHLDIQYHFVHQYVSDFHMIELKYLCSKRMIADLFTKSLDPKTFSGFVSELNLMY